MTVPTFSTNGVHHASEADEAIDSLYSFWPGTVPAPAPCPEALFSLTLRGRLAGQDAMLTIRGQTAGEFRSNLQAIRGLLDAPTPPPASVLQGKEWCAVHQTTMQRHANARGVWYSHFIDGAHCKGKEPPPSLAR